jgi:Tol biopolymer transport system component
MLYEMTSGQRAFSGETATQLHSQILESSPTPVRNLNPTVPLKLEVIIEQALQKDRTLRYQSAAEMRSELESVLREPPRRQVRAKLLIACAATIALIAAAGWFVTRRTEPRSASEFEQRQLTVNSTENPVTGGEISPDGKYLVYTDLDGIHLKLVESGESQLLATPGFSEERSPNWELGPWSPDSTHFMAIAELPDQPQTLWNFPIAAGQSRKIAEGANPWGASPDGLWVVITRNNDHEVWLTDPNGEHPRKLWDSGDDSRMRAFSWSPDGRRIAYIRSRSINGTDEAQIESRLLDANAPVVMLSGMAARDVTQLEESLRDLNWLPDGRLIFVGGHPDIHQSSCNLWQGRVDPQSGLFTAPPQRFTNWAGFCVTTFSHTGDGRKLAFTRNSDLWLVYAADFDPIRLQLSTPARLTYTEDLSSPTGWTADGSAVFIRSNREGSWGIYRQPLRGGSPQPIATRLPNVSWSTPVSPDGKWLMYYSTIASDTASPVHIMRIPLAGGPAKEISRGRFEGMACTLNGEKYCVVGEISSDGKRLVFSVIDPLQGVGGKLAEFANENPDEFAWDLSPDGRRIVLHRDMGADFDILTLGMNPTIETVHTGGEHLRMLTWAADGRGLFGSLPSQHGAELVHVDLSGRVRKLWELRGYNVFLAGRSSPDGRHVAIQGSATASNIWMIQDF